MTTTSQLAAVTSAPRFREALMASVSGIRTCEAATRPPRQYNTASGTNWRRRLLAVGLPGILRIVDRRAPDGRTAPHAPAAIDRWRLRRTVLGGLLLMAAVA